MEILRGYKSALRSFQASPTIRDVDLLDALQGQGLTTQAMIELTQARLVFQVTAELTRKRESVDPDGGVTGVGSAENRVGSAVIPTS
jgi:hypothetical protein